MNKWIFKIPKFVATSIISVVVLYLTLYPDPVPKQDFLLFPFADKVVHGLMFFAVGACLRFDMGRVRRLSGKACISLVCIVVAFLFGWAIEILQKYMGFGRSYDNFDLLADTVGAVIGVYFCSWLVFKDKNLGRR